MADNTNRVAGIASIAIDGQSYAMAGDLAYDPSTVTREELVGQDGPHGYKETPVMGHITMTLRDTGGMSVAALNAITNSTIVAQLANGKVIIGRNMFATDRVESKTTDSTIEAKFAGFSVTEN